MHTKVVVKLFKCFLRAEMAMTGWNRQPVKAIKKREIYESRAFLNILLSILSKIQYSNASIHLASLYFTG